MACGNAIRAIRALRAYLELDDLEESSNDPERALADDANGLDDSAVETSHPKHQVVVQQPVAEAAGLPPPATTTVSASASSAASAMMSDELLQAFPWLNDESRSEDDPDDEDIDEDDDDFFKPAGRCRCEDLSTLAKEFGTEEDV
eukprot:TRINITY_DN75149_c0_g1_i1.p1 TRINITY_DN75149_c0_g1~~TRINITY_DN75149_c0_g1_i1.p1  ORF type:complete len:163 (+),score=48.70 TRINITY_DN75149_c0_g1_i1:56-490(+)